MMASGEQMSVIRADEQQDQLVLQLRQAGPRRQIHRGLITMLIARLHVAQIKERAMIRIQILEAIGTTAIGDEEPQ